MAACLFCRIVSGEIPAAKVAESGECLAFRDISPQAPTHVLVIPKVHMESLHHLTEHGIASPLFAMAQRVAEAEGIAADGYRVVINTGVNGGQTVGHLHLHVLGGRQMQWPPG
ncbi:MAG TPA: histidine triad nucleotide-binding protein [Gemmatimonadaceae bacterium]|nr:histidine triad nucleotide-binding protein [Gemmatimonadaceae bacterium]